jgi:hypothetical protein
MTRHASALRARDQKSDRPFISKSAGVKKICRFPPAFSRPSSNFHPGAAQKCSPQRSTAPVLRRETMRRQVTKPKQPRLDLNRPQEGWLSAQTAPHTPSQTRCLPARTPEKPSFSHSQASQPIGINQLPLNDLHTNHFHPRAPRNISPSSSFCLHSFYARPSLGVRTPLP